MHPRTLSFVKSQASLLGGLWPDPMDIHYQPYAGESRLNDIIELISRDLSEPYSIFTYRFFLHNWPQLCYLVPHSPTGTP